VHPKALSPGAGPTRTRVLVIDDDPSTLRLLRSMLEGQGYECLTAASGAEGLRVIKSTPGILVAISDINMPGMDGIVFQKIMCSHVPPSCAPRVIFLTAHARVEFAVAALRQGAIDFLIKPVRPQELLSAVKSAVERVQRDRVALQLPNQAATLAQQAEALAAALRGWTHSQPEEPTPGVGRRNARTSARGVTRPADLALLGMDHLRRSRRAFAPLAELDDVAWDLLLELLRAEMSLQRLSVSALSISVEYVSPTTALRRIQELVKAGHIVRNPDPLDARRDFVSLASESRAALERYLEHVAKELTAAVTAVQ